MTEEETIILANTILMRSKFEKEFSSCGHYIKTDVADAKAQVESLIKEIAKLNFADIALELSQTNAIIFKIALDDELLMVITKPFFEIEDLKLNEVIFGLFRNREMLYSDSTEIEKLVDGTNKYMQEELNEKNKQ